MLTQTSQRMQLTLTCFAQMYSN